MLASAGHREAVFHPPPISMPACMFLLLDGMYPRTCVLGLARHLARLTSWSGCVQVTDEEKAKMAMQQFKQ